MDTGKQGQYFHRFGDIFDGKLFQIPDYQRGYSWEEHQWGQLVEDLELINRDDQQHFFGTVILHAKGNVDHIPSQNGQTYRKYDLIDGQQRLVTVTIYLSVLTQAVATYDKEAAAELRERHVFVRDAIGNPLTRLNLNLGAQEYFYFNILRLKEGARAARTRSHERLLEAKTFFEKHVTEKQGEMQDAFFDWLQKEISKLTQQLTVLLYAAEREADAALIFTAMNDRGKPITEMEKVKSHLLYVASQLDLSAETGLLSKIDDCWRHVYQSLAAARLTSSDHEDRLLRAHWLMVYDPAPKNWKRAASVKNKLDFRTRQHEPGALYNEIDHYLETIRSATSAYCDIYRPSRDGAFNDMGADSETKQRIVDASERLRRIGALVPFLPILMAVRIRHWDNPLEYLETVDLCERFAFRVYRWRDKRANTGQTRLFRLGHALFQGREIDAVQDDIKWTILRYCSDGQFEERFASETTNWYWWSGIRYFLYEYEQHLAGDLPLSLPWNAVMDKKRNTIEHILPQTPDAGGYWQKYFSADNYKRYKHDIGNLILTYWNPGLGNRPFEDIDGKKGKASHYKESPIVMELRIANRYPVWDPDSIEDRRNQIMEWAIERWAVERPESSADGKSGSGGRKFTLEKVRALAEEYGPLEPLDKILEVCRSQGLGVRAWRWCVTIAPPQGRQYALMAIWPKAGYLATGVWFNNMARFFPMVGREGIESIMESEHHHVDASNVDDFLARLDKFFAIVKESKA